MRIGVEVRVLHLTLDELGPFVQCHTQTPKGSALDLRQRAVWIHHGSSDQPFS
jgi:hypothetical protein